MRWIMFLILLYLMTAAQTAKLAAMPTDGSWPEILFIPMLAIFYALFAAEAAAPLAALACGAALDLMGGRDLLGTNMIPLALTVLVIVRVRKLIFREHGLAQMVMTFLGLLGFAALSTAFRKVLGSTALEGGTAWRHVGTLMVDGAYTAVVSPVFFWFYFRFQHLLGFAAPRGRGRR